MQPPSTPLSAVAALSDIGRPQPGDGRKYVEPFGLTHDDIPALVELAKRWADESHFEATSPSAAVWGPIHAWRALGELRAQDFIQTFLELLDPLDERHDADWFLEEFPRWCQQMGTPVVEPLVTYLLDAQHREYPRIAVAHGLQVVAGVDASVRDRVCETLAIALRPLSIEHPDLNAFLVSYLTDLDAVEHAELIERAFDAGVISAHVCGDWVQIAFELGLGPPPPPRRPLFEWPSVPEPPGVEPPRAARASRSKMDKAARKRQRLARKKNRRR